MDSSAATAFQRGAPSRRQQSHHSNQREASEKERPVARVETKKPTFGHIRKHVILERLFIAMCRMSLVARAYGRACSPVATMERKRNPGSALKSILRSDRSEIGRDVTPVPM